MRTAKQTAAPAPKALPSPAFSFTCNACETVQIRPDPILPKGWALEELAGVTFCFCPCCAADLPGTVQ